MSQTPFFSAFENANGIAFDSNSQIIISGNSIHHGGPAPELTKTSALKLLQGHVVNEAIFSKELGSRCMENTRVTARDTITDWIEHGDEKLMWVSGPAGSGKSTIALSIAEACDAQGWLASSFFFLIPAARPDDGGLNSSRSLDPRRFVSTLAYQLLLHPRMVNVQQHILDAVKAGPAIFNMGSKFLLEALILNPLRKCVGNDPHLSSWPTIIIIDALDICGEDAIQMLDLIIHALNDPAFPFRVLLSSRPNFWIQSSLSKQGQGLTTKLFLDDSFDPNGDIRRYFEVKFAEIWARYSRLPANWPGEEVIRLLTQKASGQFVFAFTILAYIESGARHPGEMLERVLGWPSTTDVENPFASPLDSMYTSILESSNGPSSLPVKWLHAIISSPLRGLPARVVKQFLESVDSEEQYVLETLSPLVRAPVVDDGPAEYIFYHADLKDFLLCRPRCTTLYVDANDRHRFLLDRYVAMLKHKGPEVAVDEEDRDFFLKHLVPLIPQFEAWNTNVGPEKTYIKPEDYITCDAGWWAQTLLDHLGMDTSVVKVIHSSIHCWVRFSLCLRAPNTVVDILFS
ncbi:hypothetical protein DFP72DRAFT_178850 [Ephemerocybe angulata]|uniref:Nephrocystin 3-like N-terminal domain-containing protein n=1 Tax=Ephemerocybe angulata TaxID=980116 RepID=A0A8H6MAA9_9AGAR|nr:hypothetical protein DFP72DRAFT_178850 [Tulosesus angulatus]